jgi:hypothetical protein
MSYRGFGGLESEAENVCGTLRVNFYLISRTTKVRPYRLASIIVKVREAIILVRMSLCVRAFTVFPCDPLLEVTAHAI